MGKSLTAGQGGGDNNGAGLTDVDGTPARIDNVEHLHLVKNKQGVVFGPCFDSLPCHSPRVPRGKEGMHVANAPSCTQAIRKDAGQVPFFRQMEESGNVVEPLSLEFPMCVLDFHAWAGGLAVRGTQGNNLHPFAIRNPFGKPGNQDKFSPPNRGYPAGYPTRHNLGNRWNWRRQVA